MKHESQKKLKNVLFRTISDMEASSDLFVKQPGKDFVRNRTRTFSHTINFLLAREVTHRQLRN